MPRDGEPAVLELHLSRVGVDEYRADLRFAQANDDADRQVVSAVSLRFADSRGSDAEADPLEVGIRLTADLVSNRAIADELGKILALTEASETRLHVRLFIDHAAAELQLLPWEALRRPEGDGFLFLGERISFSRFLSSTTFARAEPLTRDRLSVATMIADPPELARYDATSLDSPGLAEIAAELAGRDAAAAKPPTLAGIVAQARAGIDILFLACHGSMLDGVPVLWLEGEGRELDRVSGDRLIEALRGLDRLPRLIVLLACRGGGDDIAFRAAIGPRLAAIGVPAVVAMRGDMPLEAGIPFVRELFAELARHGAVDRAVAVARHALRDPGDALMPVLYTRLRSGRIWYRPGFVGEGRGAPERDDDWRTLVERIEDGNCLPILGTGLIEPLLGPSRDLARRWAEAYGFPLAPHAKDDLAQVAQYLAVSQDPRRPRELYVKHVRATVRDLLADGPEPVDIDDVPLDALLRRAWTVRAERARVDAYRVLAALPFRLYVTTGADTLLEQALAAAGRAPTSMVCPWNPQSIRATDIPNDDIRPTRAQPLVYHLTSRYGTGDDRSSGPLLTEDDYFDYLIGVTGQRQLIPPLVRRALIDSALLFLGFHIDEPDFRVLFRTIVNRDNVENIRLYKHIAVQVNPEEGRILEPGRARRFLDRYFKSVGNIDVYWGSANDFMAELLDEWRRHDRRDGGA